MLSYNMLPIIKISKYIIIIIIYIEIVMNVGTLLKYILLKYIYEYIIIYINT